MSTKKTTTQKAQVQRQFDPRSMSIFQALLGPQSSVLLDYMRAPHESSFGNLRLQQMLRANSLLGQRQLGAFGQNLAASGLAGAGSPFLTSQLARFGRQRSSMDAGSVIGNLLASEDLRRWATGAAMSFQPLETGQRSDSKTVQRTSGLGTWLPQIAGMALGGLGGFFGGGGGGGGAGALAHATSGTLPLPQGTWPQLSPFGQGGFGGGSALGGGGGYWGPRWR